MRVSPYSLFWQKTKTLAALRPLDPQPSQSNGKTFGKVDFVFINPSLIVGMKSFNIYFLFTYRWNDVYLLISTDRFSVGQTNGTVLLWRISENWKLKPRQNSMK